MRRTTIVLLTSSEAPLPDVGNGPCVLIVALQRAAGWSRLYWRIGSAAESAQRRRSGAMYGGASPVAHRCDICE